MRMVTHRSSRELARLFTAVIVVPGRNVFRFKCLTRSGNHYDIRFNNVRYQGFRNRWGVPLRPWELKFNTDASVLVKSIHDAIMLDPEYRDELKSESSRARQ